MSCHDEFQIEVPAFVAARLAGEPLSRMEEHLRDCDECRDITSTWKEIVPALRAGGEALFAEHPREMTLREFALGQAPDDGATARHLDGCDSCNLEVRFWQSRQDQEVSMTTPAMPPPGRVVNTTTPAMPPPGRVVDTTTPAMPPPGLFPARSIWSAAAGLLAGLGIAYLMMASATHPGAGESAATARTPGIAAISGRIPQVVLPRTVRGEGIERQVALRPADHSLIVAAQLDLTGDSGDYERYRFAIHDSDGTVVWSTELESRTIRADTEANEVVSFIVPAESLAAGRYTFVSGPVAASGGLNVQSRATIVVRRSED